MGRRGLVGTGLLALLVGCGAPEGADEGLEARQAEVAEAGAAVMPFDLDRTTHVFEKIADGGVQRVYADSDDPEQIALIREHVAEEAERFARGDFHDPAAVHGDDMAGLHDLMSGHDRIGIDYTEIPRGAQIRYATEDPEMVAAIHRWFDAQLRDHGGHAQGHR